MRAQHALNFWNTNAEKVSMRKGLGNKQEEKKKE